MAKRPEGSYFVFARFTGTALEVYTLPSFGSGEKKASFSRPTGFGAGCS
jgi:hypothetical protein